MPQLTPHHVGLVVSDLARSKDFYSALGFVVESEMGDEKRTITFLRLGAFELELFCYTDEPPALTGTGLTLGFRHFALSTGDMDTTLAALKTAGVVEQDAVPRDVPGVARLVFFRDPDGVEIEVMQPLS